jgi:hypothetical protein
MHRVLPPSEPPRWGALASLLSCCGRSATLWRLVPFGHARLQGFSSDSPAASPCQWSPKMVTTSSMVGRSKSCCGLHPALSFKDFRDPSWGGGRAEPELYLGVGWRPTRVRGSPSPSSFWGWKPSSSSAEEAPSSQAGEGELLLPSQGATFRPLSSLSW